MRCLKKKIWPFQCRITGKADDEYKWCMDNAGMELRDWYLYYDVTGYDAIAFRESETYIIFKLRWNNAKAYD
jgi:hypothetical protein